MKELICIVCPKGCHLKADENNDYAVAGNDCARGAEYGRTEMTNPTRVVTSTVRCTGGAYPRCPVKTSGTIPKGAIFEIMAALEGIEIAAPVQVGQVVLENVCGTEVNVVATHTMNAEGSNEE